MRCERCGYDVPRSSAGRCPRCGFQNAPDLQSPRSAPGYGSQQSYGGQRRSSGHERTGRSGQSGYDDYSDESADDQYAPYGQYGQSGQPRYRDARSQYGQRGQGAAPGYGQDYPPGYGQGHAPRYGEPAARSMPFDGYSQQQPYAQYQHGQQYGSAAEPFGQYTPARIDAPERRRAGPIVGVILALLVVVGAMGAGGLLLARHGGLHLGPFGSQSAAQPTTSSPPPAGAAATAVPIYSAALTGKADGWSSGTACADKADGLHAGPARLCMSPADSVADVQVTVDVKQTTGATDAPYGIIVRHPVAGNYYAFVINSSGQWAFLKCAGSDPKSIVDYAANSAIHGGLNTSNTLSVIAKGAHFDFYVNGTKVGQTDDATYAKGTIGVAAFDQIESVFTNFAATKVN